MIRVWIASRCSMLRCRGNWPPRSPRKSLRLRRRQTSPSPARGARAMLWRRMRMPRWMRRASRTTNRRCAAVKRSPRSLVYAEAKRRITTQQNEQPLVVEKTQSKQILNNRATDVTEYEAKKVLAEYGIPVTQEELATTREQALCDREKDRLFRLRSKCSRPTFRTRPKPRRSSSV